MTTITVYHNPRCSKSREALTLTQQFASTQGLEIHIVDYQKNPLSIEQLTSLHRRLSGTVRDMVRDNEEEFSKLCLGQADDAALLQALAAYPKLLQRPIVTYRARGVIGRPPERVLTLLTAA